jgi:ribonucleotide reductase alpha subunit
MPVQLAPYQPFFDGFDNIRYATRDARITAGDQIIFEQRNVAAPATWSQRAINITAQKYLRMVPDASGTLVRETSIPQMIERVVGTLCQWGIQDGYFDSADAPELQAFRRGLSYLLLSQRAAFNSPVYFNLGVVPNPLCSACFIVGVDDNMDSILDLVKVEGTIFKRGAGSGLNASPLRSSKEPLSGGGTSSGPVAFMRGFDSMCGVVKAGGTTRRAAVIRILDDTHLDLLDFIWCKALEERKGKALHAVGYEASLNRDLTFWQNSNISVRVTDAFMTAATTPGATWTLRGRHTPSVTETHDAATLLRQIAEATYECGDPGMQFHDAINRMHTCPSLGPQVASNPCFTGDTLIDTAEGPQPIAALERQYRRGKPLPLTFSFSTRTQLPVLRQIDRVWISKHTRHLVEVTTSKGIKVTCTPEHKFYLRNGQQVMARDLQPGMRLRKIGRTINEYQSNRRFINHRPTTTCPHGTECQARWMWQQVHGPIPDGFDVHHKNGDPTDDRMSNLELLADTTHLQQHASGKNNPRLIDVETATLVEVWEAVEAAPKGSRTDVAARVTPFRWNRYVKDHRIDGVVPLANTTRGLHGMTWVDFTRWIEQQRDCVNDTVVAVTPITLEREVPVYDMTVSGTHNFGVTSAGAVDGHSIIVANCGEFLWVNWSACNLASINLLQFYDPVTDTFDIVGYQHAIELMVLAQDLIASHSVYPDDRITQTVRATRTIGLGFSNLGALLLNLGLPYDSPAARVTAGALTAILTGTAYRTSQRLARLLGAFPAYADPDNQAALLRVLRQHETSAQALGVGMLRTHPTEQSVLAAPRNIEQMLQVARTIFTEVRETLEAAPQVGMRHAQVTVLAPTGTISLMMDCDTTGIEPAFRLGTTKTLVGGGTIKASLESLPQVLRRLGYDATTSSALQAYVTEHGDIDGAPQLRPEHRPVFATAVGTNTISPAGHVNMLAAVQPFLSGGISKCLTGDTLVPTSRGLLRLGALCSSDQAPDSFRPVKLRVAARYGTEPASEFYFNGRRQTVKVQLADGRRLRGTPDHRVLVATDLGVTWRRLGDLAQGDWLASRLGVDLWGSDSPLRFTPSAIYGSQHRDVRFPRSMSPDLGQWLGMLTADGYIARSNYTIGLTKNDRAVLQRFATLTQRLFSLTTTRVRDARNGVTEEVIHAKGVVEFLDAIGFTKEQVPDCVLTASRDTVLAYLSGLYLGGYLTQSLSISQRQVGLLQDVQQLWFNLGVSTYFTDNVNHGVNYPVLHVSAGYRRRAVDLLEFIEPHKARRASRLKDGTSTSVFPFTGWRSRLVQAAKVCTGQAHKFSFLADPRTRHLKLSTIQRADVGALVDLPSELLTYVYTPVTAVEDGGYAEVFDLSVPDSHSYVANGVVSHNTINVPQTATVDDIVATYVDAWRKGLKSVTIYRDGSKGVQPLAGAKLTTKFDPAAPLDSAVLVKALHDGVSFNELRKRLGATPEQDIADYTATRWRLPEECYCVRYKFQVGKVEGYLHVGMYPGTNRVGEIFIRLAKVGSTLAGLLDSFAISVSNQLQHGVPLEALVRRFKHTKFEPAGMTGAKEKELKFADSIIDHIFRWLELRFITARSTAAVPMVGLRIEPQTPTRYVAGMLLLDEDPPLPRRAQEVQDVTRCDSDDEQADTGSALHDEQSEMNSDGAFDAPPPRSESTGDICTVCGSMLHVTGTCKTCDNCGTSSGGCG